MNPWIMAKNPARIPKKYGRVLKDPRGSSKIHEDPRGSLKISLKWTRNLRSVLKDPAFQGSQNPLKGTRILEMSKYPSKVRRILKSPRLTAKNPSRIPPKKAQESLDSAQEPSIILDNPQKSLDRVQKSRQYVQES